MYRVGVIGCGRISSVYLAAFQSMGDTLRVCFCVDKYKERAQAFASHFPGCAWSDTVEDLLGADLDAVHVLTPHFLHKEHVTACLKAGFHVLTEKPIAIYEQDGREMIAAARAANRQLGVIFQNRYITGIRKARRLIAEGGFGPLKGAWSQLNWWRPASYYACDWKGSWEKEGGGVVIDQAIHSLDLVRHLVNSPVKSVQAHIDRRILTHIEVEDVADAAIVFENGVVYSFSANNYYTHNSPIRVEISGERGTMLLTGDSVAIRLEGREALSIPMENSAGTAGEDYWGKCHQLQIMDFYSALKENRPVPVDPEDALETLRLVQAIYRSARENRKVSL